MTDQPPPTDSGTQARALAFGGVAAAYDRARPSYPREAAAWLAGEEPVSVLELGAGTGKLTELLVGLGHDVHATDPDVRMLDVLRAKLPDVRASVAPAEDVPAPDASYDVVVVAEAFHWFDHERALPEIARVLRPGGRLAVVHNRRDERIPWVRRLGALIGSPAQPAADDVLVASSLFGFVEETELRSWQVVDRRSLQELVLSRAHVAALDEAGRAAKLAEVAAFYDEFGRGADGMQLPYLTRCLRATVVDRPRTEPVEVREHADPDGPPGDPVSDDGADADVLLIDFR